MAKLTKSSRTKLDEFAQAAQYWGWQQDCGTGQSVDTALKQYEEARDALRLRILLLEEQNRSLRATIKEMQRDSLLKMSRRLR